MDRLTVLYHYFVALSKGDPYALAATGVFAAFLLFMLVVGLRLRAREREYEEKRKNKWLKKKPG